MNTEEECVADSPRLGHMRCVQDCGANFDISLTVTSVSCANTKKKVNPDLTYISRALTDLFSTLQMSDSH